MDVILEFLQSGVLPTVLLIVRALVPLLALYVVWRCYTSFKKGQRRRDPVIMLWDEASGTRFPVLYWENSIGRSRSCDIYLPDPSASRDHAVLLRRDEGWFICDTGSKSGVLVNGKKIQDRKLVNVGDRMTLGSTTLTLWNTDQKPAERRRLFTGFSREAASPIKLMLTASFALLLMALGVAALIGLGYYYGTMRADSFRYSSSQIADHLHGRYRLPKTSVMQREIDAHRRAIARRYVSSKRHTIQVDFDDYMRALRVEHKRGARRTAGPAPVDHPLASASARAVREVSGQEQHGPL